VTANDTAGQPTRPIRRRKLYEEIAGRIEEMILAGQYRPGDHLPSEREIRKTFDVGRTSVREALFALQKMGLVEIVSGERARVTRPTADRLIDELAGAARHMLAQTDGVRWFQEARMLLETGLARQVAEIRTEQDLELIEQALKENRCAIDNPGTFVATDVPFHYVLPNILRNPIFMALHRALRDWMLEVRNITMKVPGSPERAYQAHKRIYEAIAAGKPDAAAEAMQEHLEEVDRVYWEAVTGRKSEHRGRIGHHAQAARPAGHGPPSHDWRNSWMNQRN
jgi:GntR family transcriptional regulator, sialic acid-inducible nan operon repressor